MENLIKALHDLDIAIKECPHNRESLQAIRENLLLRVMVIEQRIKEMEVSVQ